MSSSESESESDTEVGPVAPVNSAPRIITAKSGNHPPVSKMVDAAIETLNERNGSSLHAIKKFITANYAFDADKMSFLIKKYLKKSTADGHFLQPKGTGASGSFKLAPKAKLAAKKALKPPKPKTVKKVKVQSGGKLAATSSKTSKAAKENEKAAEKPKPKSSALPKEDILKKPTSKNTKVKSKPGRASLGVMKPPKHVEKKNPAKAEKTKKK